MTAAEQRDAPPVLAQPPRPAHPLSALQLLRMVRINTLSACDEELFDELIVERRFLWRRAFVVSDPEGVRRVLQDNYDNYPRLYQSRQVFEFSTGSGMLCAEGDEWRRHRRLINPTLDHRAIQPDVPTLTRLSEEVADYLAGLPPGQEIDINQPAAHLIAAATRHVFAGDDPRIGPTVKEMAHYPGRFGILDVMPLPDWLRPLNRWRKSQRDLKNLLPALDEMIAERRDPHYPGGKDLLWRLIHARDRAGGDRLSDAEIRDEMLTLGTTAVTPLRVLNWVWYLLALHPEAERRLHDELDDVLGGRSPTMEDMPRLPYLRQVVDETMRLYPPLPVMLRTVAADDELCGRPIPKNAIVTIAPWIIHRHRSLWDDPDRFDPDRFTAENVAARSRYAYLPFSTGPHICTGAPLSLAEILIAVAILAQRCRFRLVPGHPIEPIGWTSLRAGRGIKVTVEPRRAGAPAGPPA